jgi:predicted AlkP superfamily pyrophosphatase or phosphodiesterase
MTKFFILLSIIFLFVINAKGKDASDNKEDNTPEKPKLIVGIVVDQMRYDYITRFWDKFGDGGFKELVDDGYFFRNTNYNYVPTFTGPGHASIYSGTTPAVHGIIANDWYSRDEKKMVYCTEDKTVKTIGSTSFAGQMSPSRMLTSTITDELRLFSNMQSKVIGISLKDRGSILPAGHLANAAYWFDASNGNWISSSYYMNSLPEWLNQFNEKKLAEKYLSKDWETLLPIQEYTESLADNNKYEGTFTGELAPVFPHKLAALKAQSPTYDIIRSTPFGNSITKDIAIEAIRSEKLGKGKATDFIAISFSSTDYVGHMFGPQSIELEDTYLRLDKDLKELLEFLDKHIGKENYVLFLTADHAAVHVPSYLEDLKMPAGYFEETVQFNKLKAFMIDQYRDDSLLISFTNDQIFLNHDLIAKKKLDLVKVQKETAQFMMGIEGIADAYTADEMHLIFPHEGIPCFLKNGYNRKRSGDVLLVLQPNWVEFMKTGTTHGSPYSYDRHVPLLWYGWKVKKGENFKAVAIIDIAPTLSSILNIEYPNGCLGNPLSGFLKD